MHSTHAKASRPLLLVIARGRIVRHTPTFSSALLLSSLELSDAKVYEPQIRALLGTASHFCEVVVLKLRTVPTPMPSPPRPMPQPPRQTGHRPLLLAISRGVLCGTWRGHTPSSFNPHTRNPKPETRNPKPHARRHSTHENKPALSFA